MDTKELPRFPTMLRKMWSGGEVQKWLDENVAPLFAALAPSDAVGAPIYQIAFSDDDGGWSDTTKQIYDAHPAHMRRIVYVVLIDPDAVAPIDENAEFEGWAKKETLISESHGVRLVNSHCATARRAWDARALLAAKSPVAPATVAAAARDVLAERARQVEVEQYEPDSDDAYERSELAYAAAAYAITPATIPPLDLWAALWPWDMRHWKPTTPRRNLVKAGALILAEIERLDRAALQSHSEGEQQ
jgi:hypothetical protein